MQRDSGGARRVAGANKVSNIVTRLRQTRADMIGTDDEQHYFDCHKAAAEIERLRRWATLTDAERQAIAWFAEAGKPLALLTQSHNREQYRATLRGLLERTRCS